MKCKQVFIIVVEIVDGFHFYVLLFSMSSTTNTKYFHN